MLLPNEQEGRGGECNLLRGCAEYTVMPNNYKTVPHITELFYCLKNWFEQYWVAVYFIVDVLSGKSEKRLLQNFVVLQQPYFLYGETCASAQCYYAIAGELRYFYNQIFAFRFSGKHRVFRFVVCGFFTGFYIYF